MFKVFAVSLLLTQVIELPAAFAAGLRRREQQLLVFLVNVLTNPAAVWLSLVGEMLFPVCNRFLIQLPVELLVFLTEAFVYRSFSEKLEIRRPFLLSAWVNGISWGTGIFLYLLRI